MLQPYESEAANEYVIRGNSALLKCVIPSFVADFIRVVSWTIVSERSGELVLDLESSGSVQRLISFLKNQNWTSNRRRMKFEIEIIALVT